MHLASWSGNFQYLVHLEKFRHLPFEYLLYNRVRRDFDVGIEGGMEGERERERVDPIIGGSRKVEREFHIDSPLSPPFPLSRQTILNLSSVLLAVDNIGRSPP